MDIDITSFAGQNWVITPAARAVNEGAPPNISRQKWILVLSGVALLNLKGQSSAAWLRATARMRPDLRGPLNHAISRYSIPTPSTAHNSLFQVEQWAPFAAPSSMLNLGHSINSGFAVDAWRPNPFATVNESGTGRTVGNVFTGIAVDVAVRDSDAWFYRLSYNITLVGQIVFSDIIIT